MAVLRSQVFLPVFSPLVSEENPPCLWRWRRRHNFWKFLAVHSPTGPLPHLRIHPNYFLKKERKPLVWPLVLPKEYRLSVLPIIKPIIIILLGSLTHLWCTSTARRISCTWGPGAVWRDTKMSRCVASYLRLSGSVSCPGHCCPPSYTPPYVSHSLGHPPQFLRYSYPCTPGRRYRRDLRPLGKFLTQMTPSDWWLARYEYQLSEKNDVS